MVSRRAFLVGLGSAAIVDVTAVKASATVVRAVSLPVLVHSSSAVLVLTALSAESHYEELGRRKRIVTDTRLRVEEVVAKGAGVAGEVMVRTLGGAVGDIGEQVQGQARLVLGEACVGFVLQGPDGVHYVNGMAQGHYPLRGDVKRLIQSPDLPEIVDFESSAVRMLVGTSFDAAASRVRELSRQ